MCSHRCCSCWCLACGDHTSCENSDSELPGSKSISFLFAGSSRRSTLRSSLTVGRRDLCLRRPASHQQSPAELMVSSHLKLRVRRRTDGCFLSFSAFRTFTSGHHSGPVKVPFSGLKISEHSQQRWNDQQYCLVTGCACSTSEWLPVGSPGLLPSKQTLAVGGMKNFLCNET